LATRNSIAPNPIHPVWLGQGKELFVDYDERLDLKLIDEQRIGSGAVLCHYAIT